MDILVNDIGSEIRKRRLNLHLTQEDLAELSNMSVNFLSQLERTNSQNISIKKIDALAQALNTTTPQIINSAYTNKSTRNSKPGSKEKQVFLNKLIAELNKMPIQQSEKISKHLFYVIKELSKNSI